MSTKQRAIWTNSSLASDTNDFNFPIMDWTHLLHILMNLLRWRLSLCLLLSDLLLKFFNFFQLPFFLLLDLLLLSFLFFRIFKEPYQNKVPRIVFCRGLSSTFNARFTNESDLQSLLTYTPDRRKVRQDSRREVCWDSKYKMCVHIRVVDEGLGHLRLSIIASICCMSILRNAFWYFTIFFY